MAGKSNEFRVEDFVDHDDAEDLKENGNDGKTAEDEDEEDEDEDKPGKKAPAKKGAKKQPAKEEESEEEEEEESEEEEEEESEEEEEEESEEEEGKDKKADGKKPNPRIERMRTQRDRAKDELRIAQEKLAEIENSRTESGRERLKKMTDRMDELYDLVETARVEGKPAEAAKHQRELDGIRDKLNRSETVYAAAKQAEKAADLRIFNSMVKELEVIDPRFDKKSDDFDDELLDEVAELTDAYEAKGMAASDALRKAVKAVLREDVFAPASAAKRKGLAREEPKKQPEAKKTNVKKNLDTANKQPPEDPGKTREKGKGKIDFENMSEEDFDALPEATKRRHRGDEG